MGKVLQFPRDHGNKVYRLAKEVRSGVGNTTYYLRIWIVNRIDRLNHKEGHYQFHSFSLSIIDSYGTYYYEEEFKSLQAVLEEASVWMHEILC